MDAFGLTVLAAHDAGGARVLSAYAARRLAGRRLAFVLAGPAVDIFAERLGPLRVARPDVVDSLDPAMDRVLTATSWLADLERDAIRRARRRGVHCTAFLDHWMNFRERFLPPAAWNSIGADWTAHLPDTVVATDRYAYELALALGFPDARLRLETNPHFEDIREAFAARPPRDRTGTPRRVLWISEPVSELDILDPSLRPGFSEFTAVADLVQTVAALPDDAGTAVRIRLHPKEHAGKYDVLLAGSGRIALSVAPDLLDDLAWADAVVGMESTALVVALVAGIPVFSYFPASARRQCSLPHQEIGRVDTLSEIFLTPITGHPK